MSCLIMNFYLFMHCSYIIDVLMFISIFMLFLYLFLHIFFILHMSVSCVCNAEGCTDPEAVVGRGDDHPGVDAALERTGGQHIFKRLFEEFIGGRLHQVNQIWAQGVTVFLKETSKQDRHNKNITQDLHEYSLYLLNVLKVPLES